MKVSRDVEGTGGNVCGGLDASKNSFPPFGPGRTNLARAAGGKQKTVARDGCGEENPTTFRPGLCVIARETKRQIS